MNLVTVLSVFSSICAGSMWALVATPVWLRQKGGFSDKRDDLVKLDRSQMTSLNLHFGLAGYIYIYTYSHTMCVCVSKVQLCDVHHQLPS